MARAFLTDRRREFLAGDYDLDNSADRQLKRRIKNDTTAALDELIEVAASPEIDNSDVFDEETVRTLVSVLLHGTGGLTGGDVDDDLQPLDPDEDYAHSLYVKLDGTLRQFHKQDEDRTPRPRD